MYQKNYKIIQKCIKIVFRLICLVTTEKYISLDKVTVKKELAFCSNSLNFLLVSKLLD